MARLFLDVLYAYRSKSSYMLHEFTLIPDHFHLLISLGPHTTIEKAVQLIKRGFSFRAAREVGFKSEVWQRGFADSYIRDMDDSVARRNYILDNAVKRRLADRAEEYPYCSAYPGFELDPPPHGLRG